MSRPEIVLAEPGLCTPVRRVLETQFAAAVERLRRDYLEQVTVMLRECQARALDAERLQGQLAVARETVRGIEANGLQHRRSAEVDPARQELMLKRSARVHQRSLVAARQAASVLEERLADVERSWIEAAAEAERLRELFLAEVDLARAAFEAANADYEDALLRRHPHGDMLRALLVSAEFVGPVWVAPPWRSDGPDQPTVVRAAGEADVLPRPRAADEASRQRGRRIVDAPDSANGNGERGR